MTSRTLAKFALRFIPEYVAIAIAFATIGAYLAAAAYIFSN